MDERHGSSGRNLSFPVGDWGCRGFIQPFFLRLTLCISRQDGEWRIEEYGSGLEASHVHGDEQEKWAGAPPNRHFRGGSRSVLLKKTKSLNRENNPQSGIYF